MCNNVAVLLIACKPVCILCIYLQLSFIFAKLCVTYFATMLLINLQRISTLHACKPSYSYICHYNFSYMKYEMLYSKVYTVAFNIVLETINHLLMFLKLFLVIMWQTTLLKRLTHINIFAVLGVALKQ